MNVIRALIEVFKVIWLPLFFLLNLYIFAINLNTAEYWNNQPPKVVHMEVCNYEPVPKNKFDCEEMEKLNEER